MEQISGAGIGFTATLRRLRNLFSRRGWLTERDVGSPPPRSIAIRHLDAGSCNDNEVEIAALSNAVYDLGRYGFQFVSSPRHADVLLVSGPFTRSMESAALATFRAMPEPRYVVTVGDGFDSAGVFGDSYAVVPLPQELQVACIGHVKGDPPSPRQILDALLELDLSRAGPALPVEDQG